MSGVDLGHVVVTGGAGFIGRHLVRRLVDLGVDVLVFDRRSAAEVVPTLDASGRSRAPRYVQGDLRDAIAVRDALAGAATVFHLAACGGVAARGGLADGPSVFGSNVTGTFNVLRAAARSGEARLVFASSLAVYGEPADSPVEESHPLLACTRFAASKVAGEAYCRAFRRELGLSTAILRLASVYGPGDQDGIVGRLLRRALAGRPLVLASGRPAADLVWVETVVDALLAAARVEGGVPPINVGSGTSTPLADLAKRIAHLSQSRSPILDGRAGGEEGSRAVADVTRMRDLLGVTPPLDPLGNLDTLVLAAASQHASLGGDVPLRRHVPVEAFAAPLAALAAS